MARVDLNKPVSDVNRLMGTASLGCRGAVLCTLIQFQSMAVQMCFIRVLSVHKRNGGWSCRNKTQSLFMGSFLHLSVKRDGMERDRLEVVSACRGLTMSL